MSDVRIAVRTTSPTVAAAAVGAGATLIIDVSTAPARAGDRGSPAALAAEAGVGWVAVHNHLAHQDRGTVGDGDPPEARRSLAEATESLRVRVEAAEAAGVEESYIDPGIGTGRPVSHDLELLGGLEMLAALDRPLVVGTGDGHLIDTLHAAADRACLPPLLSVDGSVCEGAAAEGSSSAPLTVDGSSFNGASTDGALAAARRLGGGADRLEGELVVAVWAMLAGAAIVRTDHVAAAIEAARVVGAREPAGAP